MVRFIIAGTYLVLMTGCSTVGMVYCPSTGKPYTTLEKAESGKVKRCDDGNTPLNGFSYFNLEEGYPEPVYRFGVNSFLVKDESGSVVWSPYSEEEIKNILGI